MGINLRLWFLTVTQGTDAVGSAGITNVNACENSAVLKVIYFVRELMDILFFIVPILLIVMVSVDFVKNVIANNGEEMKKNFNLAIKRIIMTVFLFLIPTIVNFFVHFLDQLDVSFVDCITNAELDTIAAFESREEMEFITWENTVNDSFNNSVDLNGGSSLVPSGSSDSSTGNGMGEVLNIDIQWGVRDREGRCGTGTGDYCAAVATVEYSSGTVKYYMGYQNNSNLLSGSCRSHAFMSAVNAIKGTTYSTLDLQKYLYSTGNNGVLKASGLEKAIDKYDIDAKIYHSELSKTEAASLMEKALDNGQPVMIFVANSLCSDIAGTHHALLLLGYDENGDVIFIDSVPYAKSTAKKRNVEEMSKCLSPDSIADSYYRMIIFSFDS